MSKEIYFYQNNPCVIIRTVTDDIVEIQINHKFAQNMEIAGQCQGCCIGDSDNKISCTCDEHSWIIEEIQEEDHKLCVMVEVRLLSKTPVEKIQIDRLKKQIADLNCKFSKTKSLHQEWHESLASKKSMFNLVSDEIKVLEQRKESLILLIDGYDSKSERLQKTLDAMLVNISGASDSISRYELQKLKNRDDTLSALEAGGVDNWEWYSESINAAGK
jgi:chaperonin cofactor prefoldin